MIGRRRHNTVETVRKFFRDIFASVLLATQAVKPIAPDSIFEGQAIEQFVPL